MKTTKAKKAIIVEPDDLLPCGLDSFPEPSNMDEVVSAAYDIMPENIRNGADLYSVVAKTGIYCEICSWYSICHG